MKRLTTLIVLLLLHSAARAERSISIGVESFEWTEPSLDLIEEGTRYNVGLSSGNLLSSSQGFKHEFSGTIYQGTIDYDGSTQGGTPVQTDTKYAGFKGQIKLALRKSNFGLAGAIGIEKWSRDIISIKNTIGYKEKYSQPFVKLGVGYFHQRGTGKGRFEIGYKRPFDVEETVAKFDITLEPKGTDSLYLHYQYQSNKRWGVTVYSEKTHFKESEIVGDFRQPESKSVALGAQVNYRF